MKLAKPVTTTLGAAALTLIAAGTAIGVNLGIMSQQADPGVGNLDTITSAAFDPSQPTTRYVTVYVDGPSQAVTALDQSAQSTSSQVVAALPATPNYEHEQYEGAENDD
jgi:hypothetical protein